jgi:hypothetical protein
LLLPPPLPTSFFLSSLLRFPPPLFYAAICISTHLLSFPPSFFCFLLAAVLYDRYRLGIAAAPATGAMPVSAWETLRRNSEHCGGCLVSPLRQVYNWQLASRIPIYESSCTSLLRNAALYEHRHYLLTSPSKLNKIYGCY